jgi:4-methyl-5(b-hydroxyethyl)-thiazole monophosphate biosynthesis
MKTIVLFAEGFEEIEGLSIVDILRRANISCRIIATKKASVTGAHGVTIIPDGVIHELILDEIDAVILPGGAPGYLNLAEDEKVLDLLRNMNEKSKVIAAICASPFVLAKAGLLEGKKATIYPGMEDEIEKAGGIFTDEVVVTDGTIITSRGPATAIPFALHLVEMFKDKDTRTEHSRKLLTNLVLKEEFI